MKSYVQGTLLRRYKRFLADVRLDDGEIITAHCPNTGSMKNCVEAGATVWLSFSDNAKRKHPYTWELIETAAGHVIGINTGKANRLVEAAVQAGRITELQGYPEVLRERPYGTENSRIDLMLTGLDGLPNCFVEVKSVTLLEAPVSRGIGYFPDAVSERGAKHLRELIGTVESGDRAVLFFCVQHTGIQVVRPADHIDVRYGELLRQAAAVGVELLAYKVRKTASGLKLWRPVPVELP